MATQTAIEVSTDSRQEDGTTDEARKSEAASSASACEPYRESIEAELAKRRNAMAIRQDLADRHGFSDKYGPENGSAIPGLLRQLSIPMPPDPRRSRLLSACGNSQEFDPSGSCVGYHRLREHSL
jgi:hypothetical protein